MVRYVGERGRKTGMEPGTPVLVGEQRREDISVRVIEYNGEVYRERTEALYHPARGAR